MLIWRVEWKWESKSVRWKEQKAREKCVHLKYEMVSLHDVAALQFLPIFECMFITLRSAIHGFRSEIIKKYFIYEIMIWHINEALSL